MNKITKNCLVLIAACLTSSVSIAVQSAGLPNVALPQPDVKSLDYGLKATRLTGGWHVIAGANADFDKSNGCNIINTGFYVGNDRVWVINTGTSRLYGEQQRALINQVSGSKPIEMVLSLNLHPDYFMGNQAFPPESLAATSETIRGINAEGPSYEINLYRLCGDWMKATEMVAPGKVIKPEAVSLGPIDRPLKVLELSGHTGSDLILFDTESRLLWAGGLVFYNRIATTPHADLKAWLKSLATLKSLNPKIVVPSHGPVGWGPEAIDQTIDYVSWLDTHLTQAAEAGLSMNELLDLGVPERFRSFAAYPAEYLRNITHLYPRYEKAVLTGM